MRAMRVEQRFTVYGTMGMALFVALGCDVGQSSAPAGSAGMDAAAGSGGTVSGAGGGAGALPVGDSAPRTPGELPEPSAHGFTPAALTLSHATEAFEAFRTGYVRDCGQGRIRVASHDNGANTVSEAIGYGMLLAVAHDDRPLLDGLWNYYRAHVNGNGVMHWKVSGCGPDLAGQNGATDAELDAAMALIEAECAWGGYGDGVTGLLEAVRRSEVASAGELQVLKPGDAWGGEGCTNPSYFSPAYYRVFARYEPAQASFWTRLAEDSYTLLARAQNPATGLVPDWTDVNGTPGGTSDGCPQSGDYAYDAARTPWRVATDYLWFGTAEAQRFLEPMTEWVAGPAGGIRSIGDRYRLDGSRLSSNHNSTFVGAFALGAMAHSQERADEFMAGFVSLTRDNQYFQETLRALYLAFAAGLIGPGCQ